MSAEDPPLRIAERECHASIARRTGARSILSNLRNNTRLTASLAALDGTHGTYVYRAHGKLEGQRSADMSLRAGDEIPLHCTAAGKALLAALKADESKRLISRLTLTVYTPLTVHRKQALLREVKRASRREIATANAEYARGVVSIAVPVRLSIPDLVLAVELTIPPGHGMIITHRLVERMGPALLGAAAEISRRLAPPSPSRPKPLTAYGREWKPLTSSESRARAQEMARLREEERMSLRAIGHRYGITRQRVDQIIKARERQL